MLSSLKSLNKYFVKYKWRLTLGVIFVAVSNFFAVLPPGIIRKVMDQVYVHISQYNLLADGPQKAILKSEVMDLVMYNGFLLILFAVLRGVFMFFMRQTIIVMSRHIEYDQKKEIYTKYQELSTSFFKSHRVGDLMSRISEDVSRVRMYTGPAIMYGINLVVLTLLCLINMFRVSVSLSIYVLLPLPLLAISIFYVNKIINRKSEKIQAHLSNITSRAQETYAGIRVVKSFNQEEAMYRTFSKATEEYRKSNINLALTDAIYGPAMGIFTGMSILITVLIGGYQAINGQITVGNIAEFVIYISMLTFPIMAIGFTANMITRAAVSQRRINEFLDAPVDIRNAPNALHHNLIGKVEFRDVTFVYPHTGIRALERFNLVIEKGEKVAVMGKTGSGKSTLVHLLLRMYDVTEGEILIDGTNIKELDLSSLRKQVSYVPQDVFLFSDTIASNIAMGDTFDMERIQEAARLADVHKDIVGLVSGYDTITGERGVMLSGGQKQRISIARALYKKPAMLIMDDSLSAVDSKTENTIQQNLSAILKDKTTIIISHRIFRHWNFDKIIIMEDGRIVEQGSHETLMQLDGHYAALYQYQTEDDE